MQADSVMPPDTPGPAMGCSGDAAHGLQRRSADANAVLPAHTNKWCSRVHDALALDGIGQQYAFTLLYMTVRRISFE
jgi:hypothetical protein